MEYLGCYMFFGFFFLFVVLLLAFVYSRRLRCPLCRGEVAEIERKVTFQPTKERPGFEKATYKCRSCNNVFHRTKTLPQLGAFSDEIYGPHKAPPEAPRSESVPGAGSASYGGGLSSMRSAGFGGMGSRRSGSGGFGGGKSAGGGASCSF